MPWSGARRLGAHPLAGIARVSTILVSGGCGFIGSHLVRALLARGNAVRVLDNLSTGHLANLSPGVSFQHGDVADPHAVRRAMAGAEGCVHLAAIASIERGVQDPLGTHRVNLTGFIAVADAAAARGIPLVYASSAAAYGDAAPLPLMETALPRPLSTYGADKLGCEHHARALGAARGLRSTGLRFFNVFGPRQDPRSPYSGVISIFLNRLSRGEDVTIFGDGGQTRDFVHVSDVVAALLAALDAASAEAPVFNVCTGVPTSVLELAATAASLLGTTLRHRHGPPRAGEIRHSLGSRALAAGTLGLGSPMPLRDGLADTLTWMAGTPYPKTRPASAAIPNQSASDATRITSAATGHAIRPPLRGTAVPVAPRDGAGVPAATFGPTSLGSGR